MSRQHAQPVLLSGGGSRVLEALTLGSGPDQISEAELQALLHSNPACLPIAEIDPIFSGAVPICQELNTSAGSIDNLLLTPSGLPVVVECKLWRNPEARREVVGQTIDYAKELARWSASDMQREVSRRIRRVGNPLIALLNEAGHDVDEIEFNDALTHNLRRGRFLLLIVGDGIRENVETIAEYLSVHAGLHFSLGLIELPIFLLEDGRQLVVPRVMARTTLITREVISAPEGFVVQSSDQQIADTLEVDDLSTARRISFMTEVVREPLELDPDQPSPRVSPKGWLFLYMPAPASSCWIGVLMKDEGRRIGVRLTSNVGSIGEAAIARVVSDWSDLKDQFDGEPTLRKAGPGRYIVEEFLPSDLTNPTLRMEAVSWLRNRIREYVNVFRPRIRTAVEELEA